MAHATRRTQIVRSISTVILLLCATAHAVPFRGTGYVFQVPRGWMTRPSFGAAQVLMTGPERSANLNVVVSPARRGQTLESGAKEVQAALRKLKKFKSFGHKYVMIGGARALADEYAYESDYNGRLRVRQVMAIRGTKVVVVTCMSRETVWPRVWPAFKSTLASLRWRK
jgi:hypothetical protein